MPMEIDINKLAGGAMAERINRELQKVAENILDPNTNAITARTVTVTIKIKPDDAREIGMTDIQVNSSLAPAKGVPAKFVFDYGKDGKAVIAELNTGQDRNQAQMTDSGEVADGTGAPLQNVVNGKFR